MTEQEIRTILRRQREYFATGATLSRKFRAEQLGKLKASLQRHETELNDALQQDLGKSRMESYMCEIGLTLSELTWMQKHLRGLMREKRVPTPLSQFAARSFRSPSPYGTVLIMSPWNYPVLLTLDPLIDAIAAGNTAVVKPSAYAPATAAVLKMILEECFQAEYVAVITGGRAENQALLQQRFDMIFFTGGKTVGREVLRSAAEYLTPVTLELGGKSPCIIASDANIKRAAQRVAWGKCINSGQTCVAPDYFLVHESVADAFADELATYLLQYYGKRILQCDYYPHMINEHHFNRVCGLIDNHGPKTRIVFGGGRDRSTLRIEPTILRGVTLEDPVMKEEIFGPIIPIITWSDLDEVFSYVRNFGHPLACYLLSESKVLQEQIIQAIPFGGATINDVVIHLANNHMGFGGFGDSGMGAYHGKQGFDCFTHYKSTLKKSTKIEIPVRVPPFTKAKSIILKLMMR